MKKGANSENALNENALSEALNTIDKVKMNHFFLKLFFCFFCINYELFSSVLFTLALDRLIFFRRIVATIYVSTSRIQPTLASDAKTNSQREKYKATIANGQNFRPHK